MAKTVDSSGEFYEHFGGYNNKGRISTEKVTEFRNGFIEELVNLVD